MALHFENKEYKARQNKVIKELEARGLDGILMFQQESMYYLTGYDTFGFCFFQCLYLGCDGKIALPEPNQIRTMRSSGAHLASRPVITVYRQASGALT